MRTISDETKQQFISQYKKQPVALGDICKKFNMCSPTASKILKANNIPIYTKQQLCDPNLKVDYFSNIDSEIKAYLLGFLLADGCIYYNKNSGTYRVIFELKEEDAYIVELFKCELNTNSCIVVDNRHGKEFYSCAITNDLVANDLMNLGINIGKPNRYLPCLSAKFQPHLLRGLFDGDGCMTYGKAHSYGNSYRGRVNIVGFENVINALTHLYDDMGISYYSISKSEDNQLIHIDVRRFVDVQLYYHYMYDNAHYYLDRKKNKFEEYFKLKQL